MPHPRQQAVLEYLATHGPSAPHVIGRAVFTNTKAPNRAAQSALGRMTRDGLVVGTGAMAERRYALTDLGRTQALPPEPAPRRAPPPGVPAAGREVERDIAAELDAAGIPRTEGGRVLSLAARVQRALRERDAADTAVEAALRARVVAMFDDATVLRRAVKAAMGREPSPDDLLRMVVEAGVAALTETPSGRG